MFEQAFQKVKVANLNRDEWLDYERSLKTYRDNEAADEYMQKVAFENGVRTTAINLKNLGLSVELITKATGLLPQDIEKL